MTEPIYGIKAALDLFASNGAKMSRETFSEHVLPEIKKFGFAQKIGTLWIFDRRYLQHWSEYVGEVRKRQADGRMSHNYSLNEFDMQCFIDGAWN
jgi:hypothetical protein